MGEVVTGLTGGEDETPDTPDALKVRIWAGASKENRFTAPFRVHQDGSFVASKATISGTINAQAGLIGGFEIGPERIGIAENKTPEFKELGTPIPGGVALLQNRIKFSNAYCWASVGITSDVFPGSFNSPGLGCFFNKTPNAYGTNYGLLINVTGGQTNLAIKSKGSIVSDSYAVGYGITAVTPGANKCYIPGELTRPTLFQYLVTFVADNGGIGLPARQSIQTALGLSPTDSFSTEILIVVAATSTKTGYVTGRNTFVKGGSNNATNVMDNDNYPYRINPNGQFETGKMNLAAGDVVQFRLDYDGISNYVAYTLNYRT